jgi:mRNA-degrading endonuclease RelE of RelBE toxin-antitoxin system
MRFRVELSRDAQKQLSRFPPDVRARLTHAIDELEENDDSHWSNIKALHGAEWKGRLRKKVGAYRIIFMKFSSRGVVEVSAILIKSKDTYRSR